MSQTEASTTPAQKLKPSVAVRLLRGLGNERRIRVLCRLSSSKHSELDVTQLTAQSGLTQSALSQHLAKMRACGMLAVRRSGPRRLYRIASSDELWRILAALGGYMRSGWLRLRPISSFVRQRAAEQIMARGVAVAVIARRTRHGDNSESSAGPLP